MTVKIASLQFNPSAPTGWTTGRLSFGETINLFLGRNGSGKTPAMKGIPFALGHPIELPGQIKERCASVTIVLKSETQEHVIERQISPGFAVRVSSSDGKAAEFTSEKTFSSWLASIFAFPTRTFATKDGGVAPPYASAFIPMFWIDQDTGWKDLYSGLTTRSFLKDQPVEILRWFLGVPSLNRAVDKSDFSNAKEHLEAALEQVGICRLMVETQLREIAGDSAPGRREALTARHDQIIAELKTQSSVLDSVSRSDVTEDDAITTASRERDAAAFALNSAQERMKQLEMLGQELRAEVQILETNEVAAGAFRQLCGHEACQFFRNPEESYGRRVLFLKDQLKDFKSSSSLLQRQMAELHDSVKDSERRLSTLTQSKKDRLSSTLGAGIVSKINALSGDLSDVNVRLERLNRLEAEQKRLSAAVGKALAAEQEVERLRPRRGGGTDNSRLIEVRGELTKLFQGWLEILNAENIPQPVYFDDELNLILGKEKFTEDSSTSGSTRTRVVLAFHAAVLETSLRIQGSHPRILIMDTPKQNELHDDDLKRYVEQFQRLPERYGLPLQLFIAATEESFASSSELENVERFRPPFEHAGKPRFLGS